MVRLSGAFKYFATLFLSRGSLSFSIDVKICARGDGGAFRNTQRRQHQEQRRQFLLSFTTGATVASSFVSTLVPPSAAYTGEDMTITVAKPGDKIGVELYDVTIGNPPTQVVAVRTVQSVASNKIQPGMVLRDYSSASEVVQRVREGPYPVVLTFRNLAAAGDAISDLGTPMVTAQDALTLAKQTSSGDATNVDNDGRTSTSAYSITSLSSSSAGALPNSSSCGVKSRRGDVLEIEYDAHLLGPDGMVYDSSTTRGTGQPYQMVLGSGDMLPGVDLGLYEMCPGDVRGLQISPNLAYGARGNKMFRIPPNTPLYWKIKLVSVQSIQEGNPITRDELEGRADYVR
ncbi:hypothetical protein ACA910_009783 [Epithemia clementina (nom. ined.)]